MSPALVVAIWGAARAAGLVVGVLLGGVLTQVFVWQAVFFVTVPLAGAAAVLALRLIPADHARDRNRLQSLSSSRTPTPRG